MRATWKCLLEGFARRLDVVKPAAIIHLPQYIRRYAISGYRDQYLSMDSLGTWSFGVVVSVAVESEVWGDGVNFLMQGRTV